MLRVFQASGEEVLKLDVDDLAEVAGVGEQPVRARDLKRYLQGLCGLPRFRQRLLLPDGQILLDDAVVDGPIDLQLILLPFSPSSEDQIRELVLAAGLGNTDILVVEQLLHRPQDPNLEHGCWVIVDD